MATKSIIYKTKEEIELMRQSALMVSKTLGLMAEHMEPGVTGLELDKLAEEFIRDNGGKPGFLGMYEYPHTIMVSINEAVVHGMPSDRAIQDGDVVSIDCGVFMNGFFGDHAYTFAVGNVDPKVKKLLEVTLESLYLGVDQCRTGNRVGDIGYTIQQYTEKHGYGVVKELVGHGLGRDLHEEPQVPNFGRRGRGKMLKDGMVLAIEPMINLGTARVKQLADGWTIVTRDGKASAHFEHDVAIVNGKPELLSTFDYVKEALAKKGITT
ncbi:MAG: type I methionyl aminopeptidase [Aureispira sp.]